MPILDSGNIGDIATKEPKARNAIRLPADIVEEARDLTMSRPFLMEQIGPVFLRRHRGCLDVPLQRLFGVPDPVAGIELRGSSERLT